MNPTQWTSRNLFLKICLKDRVIAQFLAIVTILFACGAHAQSFVFPFYLDGPHAAIPTTSSGFAQGTLTYSPGALAVNISYSVSSPVHELIFAVPIAPNTGLVFTYFTDANLPPIGVTSATRGLSPLFEQDILNGLLAGRATLDMSTENFTYSEIGGVVMVPEPSVVTLLALGIPGIFLAWRRSRNLS